MDPFSIAAAVGAAQSAAGGGGRGRAIGEARAAQKAALHQENLQKEFAKNGIQWRVDDARAAGLHPLFALGANTTSYQPQSVGSVSTGADGSAEAAMGAMGQIVSRAIYATSDEGQRASRMAELQIDNQLLQNTLLESQIFGMQQSQFGPPLPSNSNMPNLTGQGNSANTAQGGNAYVVENPLSRIHSAPGNPAQEVGSISDYGFARTSTGLAVVPSKDVKERIEDQIIPELMWSARNQLSPNISGGRNMAPNSRDFPLPKGATEWRFNALMQEYQPWFPPRSNKGQADHLEKMFDKTYKGRR